MEEFKGTEKYERISLDVEVVCFPDNGPQQHIVGEWINSNGGKSYLYDGCVVNNVKTSTNANWRWESISIEGCYKSACVGDFIVKDIDGKYRIFDKIDFDKNFKKKQ